MTWRELRPYRTRDIPAFAYIPIGIGDAGSIGPNLL